MSFGIASVDYFEITDGLMPGDEVVISDMREYARLERSDSNDNQTITMAQRREGAKAVDVERAGANDHACTDC